MKTIEKFITQGIYAPSTQKRHKYALNIFFNKIKKDANTYFEKEQDYEEDLLTYMKHLQKINSHSIKIKLNTIKIFIEYHENKKENPNLRKLNRLNNLYKTIAKQQPRRAYMKDRPLDRKQIETILSYAKPNARALFAISATSGMRISEILHLTTKDIDFDYTPCKIELPASYTKTNQQRTTFITDEAKELLQIWLNEREYLKKRYKKYQNTNKIFPFKYGIAYEIWTNLITKAKMTQKHPETKRYICHIHLLRKYFRTQLTNARVPPDIAETLLGHENIYVPLSDTQLAEQYKTAISHLNIFKEKPDFTKIETQIKEQEKDLQKQINTLQEQRKDLSQWIKSQTLQGISYKEYKRRLGTSSYEYVNGKRIDYKWNKEFTKLEQVDIEAQEEINEAYKDEIKYHLEFGRIQKENPDMTPSEIHKQIVKEGKIKYESD